MKTILDEINEGEYIKAKKKHKKLLEEAKKLLGLREKEKEK